MNEDYGLWENNADAWWHYINNDKERQAEELREIATRRKLDETNLDEQQRQMTTCNCELCKGSIP